MTVAQETFQLVGPKKKKGGGPSDLVQHCVAQRCSSFCAAARVLRPWPYAGRLMPPLPAEPRDQDLSGSFAGGSDAPRAPATRVEAEPLSPKPLSTGVVDYSAADLHQDVANHSFVTQCIRCPLLGPLVFYTMSRCYSPQVCTYTYRLTG
jgi:hypothetical protein